MVKTWTKDFIILKVVKIADWHQKNIGKTLDEICPFVCFLPTDLNQFHRFFYIISPAWFNSSWVLLAQ